SAPQAFCLAMTIPQIPATAPFDASQRVWLNGYLAGLFSSGAAATASAAGSPSRGPLLFLWGSQTGGAEGLSRRFARDAKKLGFDARAVGLEEYASLDLAKESRIAVVTSTYGDGDMPDNAQAFWDFIRNGTAPRLDHVEFAVLALGDLNYAQFCEAGRRFDQRLEELGAKRLLPRADCDVDYEAPAGAWFEGLMGSLGSTAAPASPNVAAPKVAAYSKTNPFPAVLKTNRILNRPGSAKETRHFELLLDAVEYEAGDALGIRPTNCPEFVEELLGAAGRDGGEVVTLAAGGEVSLRDALTCHCDLSGHLSDPPPNGIAAAEWIASLRKLQPRLYSISSSSKAHRGEVHLTVAIVRYELAGRPRKGVCSTFLADRVTGETRVPVFVHKSPHFRVPSDGSRPIIMVGPGTGVAPFRAFLEERRATGASGRNWLFFGDQRAATDFLYEEELLAMRADGHLTRLDLAFSRDQAEKIYVQTRMLEHAADIWAWLQDGGYFYVCGDAKRMAKDVDAALHRIAETAGGLGADAAADFITQLKTAKRYVRDVY
ncbi:MAG: flavodoxin domain-containing protein, partial [Terrimicrobiaceae bacterium]|nr:flavodoxin domain-containing protein [Terrimicrobiaceae bacterium]